MDHYKPTTQTPCFEEALAAMCPGFRTLRNRKALFRFIRARTYRYLADKAIEPYELLFSVMDDADRKFDGRMDHDLIDQACRQLVPRLVAAISQ
jgi:hypothetical protein